MQSLLRRICLALVEVLVLHVFSCFLFELEGGRRSGVIFFFCTCDYGLLYIFRLRIQIFFIICKFRRAINEGNPLSGINQNAICMYSNFLFAPPMQSKRPINGYRSQQTTNQIKQNVDTNYILQQYRE